jgi:hypothetical protein
LLLKKNDRTPVKMVLLWMAGIFIASVLIPFTERMVEQHFRILPIETELVRCIRYFVPLLLLFWIWPLVEWTRRHTNPLANRAVVGLGIVLLGFWGATNRPAVRDIFQTFVCFTKAHLVCPAPRPLDELIITLRTQTQPGEGVLFFNQDTAFTSQTLSVRYEAVRPMVYTSRDSGLLSYANRSALPAWLETTRKWEALRAMSDPQKRLVGLISLADGLKADYLAIDFEVTPEFLAGQPVKVLLHNDGYTLMQLH